MGVLTVFGENLRALCATRGSISKVAGDLGISRVQFGRYLNSQSFPKPNVLQSICDYLGVDARILTDPLNAEFLDRMRRDPGWSGRTRLTGRENDALVEALSYCLSGSGYSARYDCFPDGLYCHWRMSFSRPGLAVNIIMQVKTIGGARVVRGYDTRKLYPGQYVAEDAKAHEQNQREFRGIMVRGQEGLSIVTFHAAPWKAVSHIFLARYPGYNDSVFIGMTTLGRKEYTGLQRMSRSVIVPVGRDCPSLLRAARLCARTWFRLEELDPAIRCELEKPLA